MSRRPPPPAFDYRPACAAVVHGDRLSALTAHRPLQRKSTLAWCRKHLPHITNIQQILAQFFVQDILDTMDRNRGAIFIIRAPAQRFKTLLGQLRALRNIQVEPGPALWYAHPEKFVADFADEKLNPLFDSITVLRRFLYRDRNKRAKLRYQFPSSTTPASLRLLTATVKVNRQGKTTRDIYCDEPWTYEPGWISEIQKRRNAYPDTFREVYMTTGATKDSEVDQLDASSDRRRLYVRCPTCRRLFWPEMGTPDTPGGIRYQTVIDETTDLPDEGAIRASITYECPHCHTRHPNTDATRKRWLRGAMLVHENPSPAPNTFGWHVSDLAITDWWQTVKLWVYAMRAKSRGDLTLLENTIRLALADTWDPHKYQRANNQNRPAGDYKMGDDWDEELRDARGRPMRFALIDVQQDHFYLVIRMWGPRSRSRGRFACKCFSLSELKDVIKEHGVIPERVFMDARYNHQNVRRYCAPFGWRTVMGDKSDRVQRDYAHTDGVRRIWAEPIVVDAWQGTAHQARGHGRVLHITFSKHSALDRLALLRAEKDSETDEPLWTAAHDMPEWYWRQINAHYRQTKKNSDESTTSVWLGQHNDHAGDCEAIGIIAATMAKLTGIEATSPTETNSGDEE